MPRNFGRRSNFTLSVVNGGILVVGVMVESPGIVRGLERLERFRQFKRPIELAHESKVTVEPGVVWILGIGEEEVGSSFVNLGFEIKRGSHAEPPAIARIMPRISFESISANEARRPEQSL